MHLDTCVEEESGQTKVNSKGEMTYSIEWAVTKLLDDIRRRAPAIDQQLLSSAISLKGLLEISVKDIAPMMSKLNGDANKALVELRDSRAVILLETKAILGALGELREFFIGKDHAEELRRLKEFVDLCERLNALKANGTLDAVSDVILKLA